MTDLKKLIVSAGTIFILSSFSSVLQKNSRIKDVKASSEQTNKFINAAVNSEVINIVVLPFSYYTGQEDLYQSPFRQFERDLLRNLQHDYKKRNIRFFTEEQAKSEKIHADQFLKISIDQFLPGLPIENVTVEQVSKTISTGTDSRGFPTTQIVRATVSTTERILTAEGEIDIIIADSSGKNLFKDHFLTENVIKVQFVNVKGDSRAMDGSFLGFKKDPGAVSQLEPFLKAVWLDVDRKLKQHFSGND
jgi:hypothetical protein